MRRLAVPDAAFEPLPAGARRSGPRATQRWAVVLTLRSSGMKVRDIAPALRMTRQLVYSILRWPRRAAANPAKRKAKHE